jgi:hypothetical protein
MNEKLQNLLELVRRTAWQAGDLAADAVYGAGQMADDLLSSAKLRVRAGDAQQCIVAVPVHDLEEAFDDCRGESVGDIREEDADSPRAVGFEVARECVRRVVELLDGLEDALPPVF